jgi:hypothetical protein
MSRLSWAAVVYHECLWCGAKFDERAGLYCIECRRSISLPMMLLRTVEADERRRVAAGVVKRFLAP